MRDPVLYLNPNDYLHFTGSIFQGTSVAHLQIENPEDQPVFFKVKTTKPDRYCVTPAHGIAQPGEKVSLMIKIKETDVTPNDVAKDKFLIQSILNEFVAQSVSVEEAFRRIKNADLMQQKLKCQAEDGGQQCLPVDEERNSKSFQSAEKTGSSNDAGCRNVANSDGACDGNHKMLWSLIGLLLALIGLLLFYILYRSRELATALGGC